MLGTDKGYTLVELVVVMAIFVIIMMMGSYAFDHIITTSSQQSKSAESNIEGIVGFEQLRQDLEHVGYGLPWSFEETGLVYDECDVAAGALALGVDSELFNDVPPAAPRAVLSGTSTKEVGGADGLYAGLGPDYLVVKSSLVALGTAAKKWSYINYSSSNKSYLKQWGTSADIAVNDRVIVLNTTYKKDLTSTRQLIMNGTQFSYQVAGVNPQAEFQPGDASQFYMVYGIDNSTAPKMPYNRADYYLKRPEDMPSACNPGTGQLFKAVASHAGDGFTEYPLVDCVGDMQVEFELDTAGTGNTGPVESLLGLSAEQVRSQVKAVRVFFLSHEGKKDTRYQYPIASASNVLQVGDPRRATSGRIWSSADMEAAFGADWRNYRWKTFTIAVRPKNLN